MKKIILIIAVSIFYSCNNNTDNVNSLFSENGNIKSRMNINFNAEFKFGELTKTDTTFYSYQEVDSIGNLIFSVNKYYDDGLVSNFYKRYYKYDSNNNLISENIIDIIDNDSSLTTYEYNDNNIKKEIDFLNNTIDKTTLFDYNKKNENIEQRSYDFENNLIELWLFKYDENGNVISKNKYDSENKLIELSKFEYDKNGNLLTKNKYDSEGVLLKKEINTYSRNKLKSNISRHFEGEYLKREYIYYYENGMLIEDHSKSFSYDKLKYSSIAKSSYNNKGDEIKRENINYYGRASSQDTSYLEFYNFRYDDYDNLIYKEESYESESFKMYNIEEQVFTYFN
jgi:hypothetical protein